MLHLGNPRLAYVRKNLREASVKVRVLRNIYRKIYNYHSSTEKVL